MTKPRSYITFRVAASSLFDITSVEFVKDFTNHDKISISINDINLTITVEEQWYGTFGIAPNHRISINCVVNLEELYELSTQSIRDFVLDKLNATTADVKAIDESSKLDINTEGFLCKVYFKDNDVINTMVTKAHYSLSDILKFIEDSIGREN